MAKPARSLMTLQELTGWLTFGEAAEEMGISVERVRQLATGDQPKLRTARRLGRRPIGIVREVEIRRWIAEKKARMEAAAAEQPDASWQQTLDEVVAAGGGA